MAVAPVSKFVTLVIFLMKLMISTELEVKQRSKFQLQWYEETTASFRAHTTREALPNSLTSTRWSSTMS
jgi:hypothetical protein